jgi:integrase
MLTINTDFATFKPVEDNMADIKFLKAPEIEAVLVQARKHGSRTHLMFILGFRLGLRVSEIAYIKMADISNGRISVRRLKGSDPVENRLLSSHENPLFDEKRALAAWLRERGDGDGSEYLFTSRELSERDGSRKRLAVSPRQIQRLFNRCAILAGVNPERAHTHCLKHSLGRLLADQRVPLYFIQKALGHKYLSSTQIYLSITGDEAAHESNKVLNSVFV